MTQQDDRQFDEQSGQEIIDDGSVSEAVVELEPEVEDTYEEEPEEVSEEPEEPEYEPITKFEALGKEYEIPEYMREIMTPENEEEILNLHRKAYGLDHVKTKYENTKKDMASLQEVKDKYDNQQKGINYLNTLIKNKDYHTLFNEFKIPEEEIINYSVGRVQYKDLPPEEKAEYDKNMEAQSRLHSLELQNQQYQQMLAQEATQRRHYEVDQYLNSDQMRDIVADYDRRANQPGKFKDQVWRIGQQESIQTGRDVTVEDAAKRFLDILGMNPAGMGQDQMQPPTQQRPQQTNVVQQKPVIPNVKAGVSSPVGKQITSLDELRKLANSM